MRMMRVSIALATLLFVAQSVPAQFTQNRLTDLADRLARDAEAFADTTYKNYAESFFSSSRTEIQAVLLAQQFAASSRIFYRMIVDRRRDEDLREAFSLLQEVARSVERNHQQRTAWSDVQGTMNDLSRELNIYPSDAGGNQGGGGNQGSARVRMTWKGRVDDDVRIVVRGGRADVETLGGTPYNNSQPNFSASLPPRRVNVRLNVKRGRGEVVIEEQPSRENNFAAVIRIKDPRGGASDYEFELSW